jgi:uncharacterized membrane protein
LDEAKLYRIAQGTFGDVIAKNASINSAPPLYALLVNLVSRIGDSERVLRSISNVFGIISIPMMFLLARRFMGLYSAYLCGLLVALSLSQVRYSLELREYSLTFLVTTLIFITFHKFLERPDWRNWFLVTTFLVLGIFTQYGLALLIVSLNAILVVYVVLNTFSQRANLILFFKWGVAQILILGAVAIVYSLSLKVQFVSGGFGSASYLQQGYWNGSLSSLVKLGTLNTYELFDFAFRHPSLLLFFCGLGLLYALGNHQRWVAILFLAVPMVVSLISALLRLYPYYGGRQVMFLIPMIFVFAGLGFGYLLDLGYEGKAIFSRQTIAVITILVFAVTGLRYTLSYYLDDGVYLEGDVIEDIKPLVTILQNSFEPNDRIYVGCRAGPAFRYYYRENHDRWIVKGNKSLDDSYRQLNASLNEPGRMWMIFSHCTINDEHRLMVDYASRIRDVKFVSSRRGAWLYLAE